jgi:hypothetical protein
MFSPNNSRGDYSQPSLVPFLAAERRLMPDGDDILRFFSAGVLSRLVMKMNHRHVELRRAYQLSSGSSRPLLGMDISFYRGVSYGLMVR